MATVRALARSIDARHSSTRGHSERVAVLAERLALAAGWPATRADRLYTAALLHDVGKIGIPDEVLFKAGELTGIELDEVRRHAALSARIASEVLGNDAVRWIHSQHERWDGSGYPDGLAGEAIPDGARILCLADAWDAMTTRSPYSPGLELDAGVEECVANAGRQFAPEVVDALLALRRGNTLACGADLRRAAS
jgi:HD-GYP domain-containing protein (c-di-GMP phosphodiesterase class II)